MARVQHNCTGCVPIDASIIEVYTQLISTESRAEEAAERAEHAAEYAIGKSPYIGENGDWWEWDDEQAAFIDTGVQAQGQVAVDVEMSTTSTNPVQNRVVTAAVNEKQDTLVSGTNIKTVNGESLLGEGNIIAGDPNAVKYVEQTLTDAQKAQARTNIAAYQKPAAGIPATDLTSAAQTSLGKADSAYQKPGSGIPKADLDSSVQTSLGKADTAIQDISGKQDVISDLSTIRSGAAAGATAYQKPSGGIPKSDLSSGVQGSLDLADSAIQARPQGEITPVITPADYATREELGELEAEVDALNNEITGLYYEYTDNSIINPCIKSIYLEGYEFVSTPKIGFYRLVGDVTEITIQILDGETMVSKAYVWNTASKNAIGKYVLAQEGGSGCTGYVICNPKLLGDITSLNSQKGIEKIPGLWFQDETPLSIKIEKLENCGKIVYPSNDDTFNKLVKGIYISTNKSGLTARFYIDDSWKSFQIFKNSELLSQIAFSTGDSNTIIGSADGVLFVEFGDITSVTETTTKVELNDNVTLVNSFPTISSYIYSNPLTIKGNILNYYVKELFVNTDYSNLKARIYVDGSWRALQIFKSDGTTLIEQYVLSDGIVRGITLGGLAWMTNTESVNESTSTFALFDKVKDITTQPLLNNYNNKVFVVKSGSNTPYNTILKGVLAATKFENATVIVDSGSYNIQAEFEDYYGDDFFTNFTRDSVWGIYLSNGVHVKFSPNAVVNFNYQGSNDAVKEFFAPFNTGKGGCTIEGLKLSAKNCRYCIHDDRGTSSDFYINNYINCELYLDNTNNSAWSSRFCIGGGLGANCNINIRGCIFNGVATGINTHGIVSYHNSASQDAKSVIHLENCYCKDDGTFRLTYYGTSTKISTALVCGNSFGSAIEQGGEAGSTNINTELIEWNNIIRT